MVYTVSEYAKQFMFCGKFVSTSTIKNRCKNNMMPSNHVARKLKGKTGCWIIEVFDK